MSGNVHKNPFIIICIYAFAGIMGAKYLLSMNQAIITTFLFICFAVVLRLKKRTPASNFFLLLALGGAMAIRFNLSSSVLPENHLCTHNVKKIETIEGVIDDCFIRRDGRNRYILIVDKIAFSKKTLSVIGKVLLYTKNIDTKFSYGDRIRLHGQLRSPDKKRVPGQFDYRQYLAEQDIFHLFTLNPTDTFNIIGRREGAFLVRNLVIPIRVFFRETFKKYLSDQTSSLLMALILGEKQDLDAGMVTSFRQVGVVHVLAISGLHVGFIIAFVFGFLSLLRLNQANKLAVLALVLVIYIILVRFKTPVIRASAMAVLFLTAKRFERRASVYNIIFASMFLILMIDPRELFKPGFQFSFSAVLSIIYGYEKLNHLLPFNNFLKNSKFGWINNYVSKWLWIPFLVSIAAVLGTLPLTLYYYGVIPLYAIFANLIIIPITGLIVFLSLFLLFTALFSHFLSAGIGVMITFINTVLQQVTEMFAGIPLASIITIRPALYQIMLLYMFLYFFFNLKTYGWFKTFLLSCLPFALLIISFSQKTMGDLKVTFLDVGQGDAAFLEFPNGKTMLIDAGNASRYWDYGEKTILPFLQSAGILNINYLVGSHAHNDHIGGFLYLLEKITIDTLVLSSYQYHSNLFKDLKARSLQNHICLKTVYKGDQLYPDPNCRVYILHPDSVFSCAVNFSGTECNNSSLVIKIQYGENGILFMGDLERQGEIPAMAYDFFLESEILKVGHHGSVTSTSDYFLEKINPIAAVVSVAKKNKFSHPSPLTLERLHKQGARTFLTSHEGTVQFFVGPEKITRVHWR